MCSDSLQRLQFKLVSLAEGHTPSCMDLLYHLCLWISQLKLKLDFWRPCLVVLFIMSIHSLLMNFIALARISVCLCAFMHACMYMYVCACVHVYVRTYVHVCVRTYVLTVVQLFYIVASFNSIYSKNYSASSPRLLWTTSTLLSSITEFSPFRG